MQNTNNTKNNNKNKRNYNKFKKRNNNNNRPNMRQRKPPIYRYVKSKNPAPNISRNAVNAMVRNYRQGIKQYLRGLLFPEEAMSGSYVCKQPSYVGLPTSNVVFKEQINFTITESQKFGLIWVPNYLSTAPSLDKHCEDVFYRRDLSSRKKFYSHLYFTTNIDQATNWKVHTSFLPNIDLSKYRLVSSKISVQYNGNIMNQSGQIHSCVIYDDLPVFIGYCDPNEENPEYDMTNYFETMQMPTLNSYLDIEKIRNGLWTKYVNVTNNTGQIDNIALPTDPTDHTFFPLTHYYAKEPEGLDSEDAKGLGFARSFDGGHLSYVYLGDGLPKDANMTVVIYYNFEIIATQSTATFLRGKKDEPGNKVRHFISEKQDMIVEEVTKFASENNNLFSPDKSPIKVNNNVMKFINTLSDVLLGAISGNWISAYAKSAPKIDSLTYF